MISFSYPAYAEEPKGTLSMPAQVIGDLDVNPNGKLVLFTMDGKPISRKITVYQKIQSRWLFRAICNIETVRKFFQVSEGEYIKYTHYDGTEWVFILRGAQYQINTSGERFSFIDEGVRKEGMSHDFELVVDRWKYVAP